MARPAKLLGGLSLGGAVGRMQDDFGVGGQLSSPIFARMFRLTMGAGASWYPHGRTASGEEKWEPFFRAHMQVEIGPEAKLGFPVRPYGFVGLLLVDPPASISSQRVQTGGLGGFGLEVGFVQNDGSLGPVTYFFEAGGVGCSAVANRLPGSPNLVSGFVAAAGFRAYL